MGIILQHGSAIGQRDDKFRANTPSLDTDRAALLFTPKPASSCPNDPVVSNNVSHYSLLLRAPYLLFYVYLLHTLLAKHASYPFSIYLHHL